MVIRTRDYGDFSLKTIHWHVRVVGQSIRCIHVIIVKLKNYCYGRRTALTDTGPPANLPVTSQAIPAPFVCRIHTHMVIFGLCENTTNRVE